MTTSTAPPANPSMVASCSLAGTYRDSSRNRERVSGETLAERRVVLGGEDGRRHQDRDLLAALDGLEHAAQRHFGLAVAHVTHDEAVHGPAGFHVVLHLGHGLELVLRLLIRERGLELLLPGRVRG